MSDEELTYLKAANEIDEILENIEDDRELDIDELAGKVERAAKLIGFCHERLKNAETRVRKIADELTVPEKERSSASGDGPAEEDVPF